MDEHPSTAIGRERLSPEERAERVRMAKERAAVARAAHEGGALPPEARSAAKVESQAAIPAAEASQIARATAAPGATATAAPDAAPSWHVSPGGVTTSLTAAQPEPRAPHQASLGPLQRVVLRRRQLLRGGFWAGLAALAVGGLVQTLDLMNPRDIHGFGGVITIPASVVPKPGQSPYHYLEAKTWLVNLKPDEGVPEPFLSVAPASKKGGLLAIYQKCPHLGCTVPWRSDFEFGGVTGWFRCPCHGSTYTKGGVRVFGPAPRSMDTFQITKIDQSGVSVNTGRITLGSTNDPQRTLPPGPFT